MKDDFTKQHLSEDLVRWVNGKIEEMMFWPNAYNIPWPENKTDVSVHDYFKYEALTSA